MIVVDDFFDILDRALDRGAALLTSGEQRIVARMRRLEGEAAIAYARLTTRVPTIYEVDRLAIANVTDVPTALDTLTEAGLVDGLVTWRDRAHHLRNEDLIAILRARGASTSGRRDQLLARLDGAIGFTWARFVRVRHRKLVRRLERWAFLKPWPDRNTVVLDRIGVVKWPDYATTSGEALPATRRRWLAYEDLADRLFGSIAPLTPQEALDHLCQGTATAPGRLDLRRTLRKELLDVGHHWEREGRLEDALALYQRLVDAGGARRPAVAFRWAQALHAAGRSTEAFALLAQARREAHPTERLGLVRAQRRIGRGLRRSVAPDPPLLKPLRRQLRLPLTDTQGARPRWGEHRDLIEAAVCRWLAGHGRSASFGESRPFTMLFALLFADVLFQPVPGALPVRWLTGPLDFGTPHFRNARQTAIETVFAALDRGEAPDRIRDAWARYHGQRVLGARWDIHTVDQLVVLAQHLGPTGLRAVLDPMLDHGLRVGAGLPDLVIWPGRAIRLPDALPSRLSEGLCVAEIKGPKDRLRDGQRMWLHRLLQAGVPTELWEIAPPPTD
ncbi:MAG: VRR-NUC domain-containing protein [Myxococcota bacterium]